MGNKIRDAVVSAAKKEIGYKETGTNINKFAAKFDAPASKGGWWQWYNTKKNGAAWCQIFLAYCFCEVLTPAKARTFLGIPKPAENYSAACPQFWNYLVKKGYKIDKTKGQKGDIIFFNTKSAKCGHVGIIESVSGGKYKTIEGNKSNKVGTGSYTISASSSTIYGICHPKWENIPDATEKPVEKSTEPSEPIVEQPATPSPVVTPKPAKPTGKTYTVITKKGLNVRKGAGKNYDKIPPALNYGAKVTVYETKNGWGRIGTGKWVCMDYLK